MIYTNTYELRNTRAVYNSAFYSEMYAIWGATPFRNEVGDLCYKNAASCFLRDSEASEEDRRKLLYSYLTSYFGWKKDTDPLNKEYPNLPTDNTVVNRILNNICFAYNQAPSRKYFVNETEVNDKTKGSIEALLKECGLNRQMKRIYKIAKLMNEAAVRPVIKGGKLKLQVLTNDLYRAKYDDFSGELLEFAYPFQFIDKWGEINTRFHVWTDEYYTQRNMEYKPVKFEYNGKQEIEYKNPYGVIPFIINKFEDDTNVYGGQKYELIKNQLVANMIDFLRDENLIYSGFGVWLAKNFNLTDEEIALSPGRIYTIDSNPEDPEPMLEHISSNPNYNEMQLARDLHVKNIMRNLGLPNGMINDAPGLQSGVAMLIDRLELEENRQDDIEALQEFENDIINMTIIVTNADRLQSLPNVTVETDYVETSVMLEPDKEYQLQKQYFTDGLITPLQFVVRTTGNNQLKTDEDAIEYINNNLLLKTHIGVQDGQTEPRSEGPSDEGNSTEPTQPTDEAERRDNV